MRDKIKCGHCRHATGTTAKAYMYCHKKEITVLRDSAKDCFEREPGADDDKGESNEQ